MTKAKKQRLDKVLAHIGIGSRREIKKLAQENRILVNGTAIRKTDTHIDPWKDVIEVDGVSVRYREWVYIMLNKPAGYLSATEDAFDQVVLELLPAQFQSLHLFPVGRLDKDTEGLLLMTNDGQLAHQLLSPKKHVSKTYYAKINGHVTLADIEAFRAGVVLDGGYTTMPAVLRILAATAESSEVELSIVEGKFHQIKRMMIAVGKEVVYLKRLSMGTLVLDERLGPGEWRELTDRELQSLRY